MVLSPADSLAQARDGAPPPAELVGLLHTLALRRGCRLARSRVAEALSECVWPQGGADLLLRAAEQALRRLGLPGRVVRLSVRQAAALGPTLASVPGQGAGPILWPAAGSPPLDTEITAIDLRTQPCVASLGAWLWHSVRAESRYVVWAALALALSQALALLGPAAAWLITDRALPDGAASLLTVATIGLVIVALHGALLGVWRDRIARSLDQRLRLGANAMMFDALLRTPYERDRQRTVGDRLQLLSSAESVAGAVLGLGLTPALGLVGAAVAWATLCALVPVAAWSLAAFALAVLTLCIPLARTNTHWQTQAVRARGAQQSLLLELLHAVAALRVAGAEHAGARRWLRRLVDEQTATLGQVRSGLWLDVLLEGSLHLTRAAWLTWGGMACVDGEITLGAFLACAMFVEQCMRQTVALSHAAMGLTALAPHWQRVNAALKAADIEARPAAVPPDLPVTTSSSQAPAVRVDNAWFRYDDRAVWTLRDHSLHIPAGALVVLSGASGAGKTTLLRLLSGLLKPQQGQIEIFGRPAHAGSPLVGYLPQEAPLFEGSIASNLRWLAGGSTQRTLEVARRTGLDDWVRTLPMGYATRVSEGGGAFSGGQRQLIALTAVLASQRPLLLLDEPMSQLDRVSRRRLLDSGLFQGRTVVVISHDRNSIDLLHGHAGTVINLDEATAPTSHPGFAPARAAAA